MGTTSSAAASAVWTIIRKSWVSKQDAANLVTRDSQGASMSGARSVQTRTWTMRPGPVACYVMIASSATRKGKTISGPTKAALRRERILPRVSSASIKRVRMKGHVSIHNEVTSAGSTRLNKTVRVMHCCLEGCSTTSGTCKRWCKADPRTDSDGKQRSVCNRCYRARLARRQHQGESCSVLGSSSTWYYLDGWQYLRSDQQYTCLKYWERGEEVICCKSGCSHESATLVKGTKTNDPYFGADVSP